ncbi:MULTISPECIES: response regulator [unclassified Tolypothrix]|uniref:response regulator n=1 Tax=unclassified Tolypothrix TaxID=2649714 RepID=UPI0005F86C2C|nr:MULTISPECIES: response regulator [unclassified Tolypothrix]MBE9085503.1 response regulator [Tolypothrix sp. LEGE 11397]UYD26286.1 response regulator [Tolypothrix sp. PCC 7712]UYD31477.1 response regulator [Tolypothrix sp. PCC 7601]BAY92313.1 response regulator receiver protein [Microchaete diplosiphon NIES-3275]
MNLSGSFTKLRPQSLLSQLSKSSDSTYLRAFSNSVTWSIYLEQGKITYATHSVEPFDRLERHLRRLSHQIPLLTSETRVQLRLMFEVDSPNQLMQHQSNSDNEPPDYQAIVWLVNQGHLHSTQAAVLIQELVKEVIESLLLIKMGNYELSDLPPHVPKICRLDVEKIIERCQTRLERWQSFAPHISSPYQRPYLFINKSIQNPIFVDLQPNLTYWMKGFSLRHLAVIMNQDEIQLAQHLYHYIVNGGIILHEADPPFDKLPKTFSPSSSPTQYITEPSESGLVNKVVEVNNTSAKASPNIPVENIEPLEELSYISSPSLENHQELTLPNNINLAPERVTTATATAKKVYKIISVDDSPTILREISRFLEDENFAVVTIEDPLKAVMSIIRHKPDLILLDLNMAGIDGYELCRIIRNNSMFKHVPVIFVTGNKGLVDKVKANLVGASGYLTKPFTRAELLKLVFMHLA